MRELNDRGKVVARLSLEDEGEGSGSRGERSLDCVREDWKGIFFLFCEIDRVSSAWK
jgi:hypothetical protein